MGGKGSGGHNKKSAAQKKAEGNRGRRPVEDSDLVTLPGEPQMPFDIAPGARSLWPQVCSILAQNKVLFKSDGIAIAKLCSDLYLWMQLDHNVCKFGPIIVEERDEKTGTCTLKRNPAVNSRAAVGKDLADDWARFGLDPSARAGIIMPDQEKESALEKLLRTAAVDEVVN